MDAPACRQAVDALAARIEAWPNTSTAQVLKAADAARRAGYAYSDEQVVRGVRGVSVCIRDARGTPVAGLGIAAIRERLRSERVQEIVRRLRKAAAGIEGTLTQRHTAPMTTTR
jgi:DNA-binding IclR family transcriptional regulator